MKAQFLANFTGTYFLIMGGESKKNFQSFFYSIGFLVILSHNIISNLIIQDDYIAKKFICQQQIQYCLTKLRLKPTREMGRGLTQIFADKK